MNGWEELTPQERMQIISRAMANPCPEDEHVYEDRVDAMGNATFLSQICKVCFNMQGWIYNWQTRD